MELSLELLLHTCSFFNILNIFHLQQKPMNQLFLVTKFINQGIFYSERIYIIVHTILNQKRKRRRLRMNLKVDSFYLFVLKPFFNVLVVPYQIPQFFSLYPFFSLGSLYFMGKNYYDILNVSPDATPEELKKA